jgi:hypothetical protein
MRRTAAERAEVIGGSFGTSEQSSGFSPASDFDAAGGVLAAARQNDVVKSAIRGAAALGVGKDGH